MQRLTSGFQGSYEHNGKKFSFFKINLVTIDQPQEGIDLSDFEIAYVDGLSVRLP
jgi:hypothetical protein